MQRALDRRRSRRRNRRTARGTFRWSTLLGFHRFPRDRARGAVRRHQGRQARRARLCRRRHLPRAPSPPSSRRTWFAGHAGDRLIVVPDPLEALRALRSSRARSRSKATIVAVTGSAGKTTTKEAIRTVLAGAPGQTHYSIKSLQQSLGRAVDAGAAAARGAVSACSRSA